MEREHYFCTFNDITNFMILIVLSENETGYNTLFVLVMLPHTATENLLCIVGRCRREGCLFHAHYLISFIFKSKLHAHETIGNFVISMLVGFGCMDYAQNVYDRLILRNEYSLYCMINGYVHHGKSRQALLLYQKCKGGGVHYSARIFTALLKACTELNNENEGSIIHEEIIRNESFTRDVFIGSTLIDMYAKCGSLKRAQKVFDELLSRNVVSWNALISGFSNEGSSEKALQYFEYMLLEGVLPNAITYICSLKACGSKRDIEKGREIHAEINERTLLYEEANLGNALVDMYAKCGAVATAEEVFDILPLRTVATWNALIAGYCTYKKNEKAIICFDLMQLEGVLPDCITFSCIIKACVNLESVVKGREIYAEIMRKDLLQRDLVLSSVLIDMHAKFGFLSISREIFDNIAVRDVVSWTAMISGYVDGESFEEAINCFDQMQLEGLPPDSTTFSFSLKACGNIGASDIGKKVHADIERRGLLSKDVQLCSALLDMYVKCGLFIKAYEVFDKLVSHDTMLWNIFIAGYTDYECAEEALETFEEMQLENVTPDAFTFVHALKACAISRGIETGKQIHVEVERQDLIGKNLLLGNALVGMYSECAVLVRAQQIFDDLPYQDVVSWNILISGYEKHECSEEALMCYKRMQLTGISPNDVTFACILKACSNICAIEEGIKVHNEIITKGLLEYNYALGGALIEMYAKCGFLGKAQELFDSLSIQSIISWNALIAGNIGNGQEEAAVKFYEQMQLHGVSPDPITFQYTLKACGITGHSKKGMKVHAEIERIMNLTDDDLLLTALVDMYAKCALIVNAREVFDKLVVRETASWNIVIAACTNNGYDREGLFFFQQMLLEGVCPDVKTLVHILKACGSIGAEHKGTEIHSVIESTRLLERETVIGNSLVDMYARYGWLVEARKVFENLSTRNIVSWNTLITCYTKHEYNEDVLECFRAMQLECLLPDYITFTCVVKACGSIRATAFGREIHAEIERRELLQSNSSVGTALVDMYIKFGALLIAEEVFDRLSCRDTFAWNALITGYVKCDCAEEALDCFEQMQIEGVSADTVTLLFILKACGTIASIEKGLGIHGIAEANGFLTDSTVGNSLVDMYAKCGMLVKAQDVFEALKLRGVVSWNVLIAGCAQLQGEHAFRLFNRLEQEGSKPDSTTFISILCACNHVGLIETAQEYLISMIRNYSIIPNLQHFTCIIESLSRAGQLNKAAELIAIFPFYPDVITFSTLLGACRKWGNMKLGSLAFEQAVCLKQGETTPYLYMYNLYADAIVQEQYLLFEHL